MKQGNRYPLIYEIDEFRCVFCGYCQEVCPEEAIHVGVHYENSEYSGIGLSTIWSGCAPRAIRSPRSGTLRIRRGSDR